MEDLVFIAEADGSEQRAVLLPPPGFDARAPVRVLFALHGHGSDRWQYIQNPRAECLSAREVAAENGLLFVSPDYRASTSWMGPLAEADLVQLIHLLKRRFPVTRVYLTGASMGGASSLTFAIRHPELLDGVASLNGTANHLEYEQFQDAISASFGGSKRHMPLVYKERSAEYYPERLTMPLALVVSGQDKLVPPDSVRRLARTLCAIGKDFLLIDREAEGHQTSYADARAAVEAIVKCSGTSLSSNGPVTAQGQ